MGLLILWSSYVKCIFGEMQEFFIIWFDFYTATAHNYISVFSTIVAFFSFTQKVGGVRNFYVAEVKWGAFTSRIQLEAIINNETQWRARRLLQSKYKPFSNICSSGSATFV